MHAARANRRASGDVVAGLSKALRKRGHDARIIMPLYGNIDRFKYGIHFSHPCCVHFGRGEEIWVGVFEGKLDGVPIWFVDYERYFGRPYIYDGQEDCYRFGVLSKAALQICKDLNWIPHIAHVHDWMTSLSAVFLKTWDRVLSPLSNTASVLTIHNIGYQGKFSPDVLGFYGFGADYLTDDKLEDFGGINLLKAGIQYADAITTVSPTYANEIRGPIGGMGMHDYLNRRGEHVFGIVNGVDTDTWNPATDRYLPARYSVDNMAGKAACKKSAAGALRPTRRPESAALRHRLTLRTAEGLRPDPRRAAAGAARHAHAGRHSRHRRSVHGTFLPLAAWRVPAQRQRAHRLRAGTGAPDRGRLRLLHHAIALRAVRPKPDVTRRFTARCPSSRATGGLDDTVENYTEQDGGGTGFKFWDISQQALYHTIGWAVSTWWDRPQHYAMMQKRGMQKNFTLGRIRPAATRTSTSTRWLPRPARGVAVALRARRMGAKTFDYAPTHRVRGLPTKKGGGCLKQPPPEN